MIVLAVIVLSDTPGAVEIEVIGKSVAIFWFTTGIIDLIELHDGLFTTNKPAGSCMRPPVFIAGKVKITRT
jgi:hypothetical protein